MGGGAWQLYIIGPPGPQRRGKAPWLEAGIYKKGMEMSPSPLLPELASNRLKKTKSAIPLAGNGTLERGYSAAYQRLRYYTFLL